MKYFLSTLLLLFSALIHAQDMYVKVSGYGSVRFVDWKFSSEDLPAMSAVGYDDSRWISVSSMSKSTDSTSSYFHGLGWFRKEFLADSSLTDMPLAMAVNHLGASEIYLDGNLIKTYGRINGPEGSEYYNPLQMPFVINSLIPGKHLLAVRYANYNLMNSEDWRFSIVIGNANDMIDLLRDSDLAASSILIAFGLIFFTLGILHLFFFLYYRKIKSNLFFCIFMLASASLFFYAYMNTFSHNSALINDMIGIGVFLICVTCASFGAFIHVLFDRKMKVWFWIVIGLSVLAFFSYYTSDELYYHLVFGLIVISVSYGVWSIVVAMVRKVPGAWIIGSGVLFFFAFLVFLIGIGLYGEIEFSLSSWPVRILVVISVFAVVSIPLSMSVYQAWSFSMLNKDLSHQLVQVKELSAITLKQEQEKKTILENQKTELEIKVNERTQELRAEKKKSDDLLLNILPEEVAEELKTKGSAEAQLINEVTVLFTDFKGFTKLSEKLTPRELVAEINECFSAFDLIMEKHGVEKIKTIGDAYMAAGGLPTANTTHASDVINAALEIQAFMRRHKEEKEAEGKLYFEIRIGIHTGPVVAGIVGIKKFAYDIWGDTVNTAARMESSGEVGKVNISETTYSVVKNTFNCIYRGKIQAKGKGEIDMYFVEV